MRFLADESCDFAAVRALRAAGHDVVAVAEITPAAADDAVLSTALATNRILLTEDKDFGQLVYAHRHASGGVIFIRFPIQARSVLGSTVVRVVEQIGQGLIGAFVTVQPGRTRVSRRPD